MTRGALVDLSLRGSFDRWSWVAGVEMARDDIVSSNLGRHRFDRKALFAEIGRFSGPLTFALQGRIDDQDTWGAIETLAAGGRWRFHSHWSVRASWGQSFRAPSFTDLYYDSPSTVGDSDLRPEEGQTLEIGLEGSHLSLTLFRRQADQLIDYLLRDDGIWAAENLGRLKTDGIEAGLMFPGALGLQWQRLGVTWLNSTIDVDPVRSRYALAHPQWEAAWTGAGTPGDGWRAGWALRYRKPTAGGSWTTLDLRLGRRILPSMWLDLEANNVLDRSITEVPGVPLPGRWVTLTAIWSGSSK